jgi:hypothetical protein
MLAAGRVRAGVVVRNVTTPEFGPDEDAIELGRHARAGVAWGDSWPAPARTIVAVDVDLTRVAHPAGERRDVAAGVERWLRTRRVAVRGGVRASTVGDSRPVVSGGASYAVRAGTYVDGYVAGGDRETSGWGLGLRVSF